jgi:putative transposase
VLRKEKFIPGEYYHIYSRVISGTPYFKNNTNAAKLTQAFLLSNSTKSGAAFDYLRHAKTRTRLAPKTDFGIIRNAIDIARRGEKLADVLCYSVMTNHYHLLLKELKENGITDFLRSCNTSIAKYINIKTGRTGPLFESRFKSKHINSNKYLVHLSLYIHLNPLDFLGNPDWREHKFKNWHSEKGKLLAYPWSSLKNFLDNDFKNPIISGTEIISEQFSGGRDYETFLREWSDGVLESMGDIIID